MAAFFFCLILKNSAGIVNHFSFLLLGEEF